MKSNVSAEQTITRIEQARWWMLQAIPHYGQMACQLEDVITSSVQTCATDGVRIYWNPEFIALQNTLQLRYCLAHETLHPAHLHLWRLPSDDEGNQAGDYEIELTLRPYVEKQMMAIPTVPGGEILICPKEWESLAAEEILHAIRKKKHDSGGNGGDGGKPRMGDFMAPATKSGGDSQPGEGKPGGEQSQAGDKGDGGNGDGADTQAPPQFAPTTLKEDWQRAVLQANQVAQVSGRGDGSLDAERELERMRQEQVDWRAETMDFARTVVSARNDYSRPARRHAWQPVIYPRKRKDRIGMLAMIRDTSSSITPRICGAFNEQGEAAQAELECSVLLIDADAAVKKEYTIEPGEPFPDRMAGGGGTDFGPALRRVAKLIEEGMPIAGCVFLTDGVGKNFDMDVDFPLLWLCTTRRISPVGRTVRINVIYGVTKKRGIGL